MRIVREIPKLADLQDLRALMLEAQVPVILNAEKGRGALYLRLPGGEKDQDFVWGGQASYPDWNPKSKIWQVSRSAMQEHAKRCLAKWGTCWIVQPYKEREVCAPACQHAQGLECDCSCMGLYHGQGAAAGKWHVVNDAFCVRWGETVFSARLIAPYAQPKPEPKKPVMVPWTPPSNSEQAQELAARIRAEKEEALMRRKCAVDDFL